METAVTAEGVFDKHLANHGLPKRKDESLDTYVRRIGDDSDELTRCLGEAVAAASVADHVECAHWCAQARHHLPRKK